MSRETIFEGVEIDIPRCSRVFGVAPCTATLSVAQPDKCWNLRRHCGDPANYLVGTPLTIRLCKDAPAPKNAEWWPIMRSARLSSTSVNIAGSAPDLGTLGRLATLDVETSDFRNDEWGVDPYVTERFSGAAQLSGVGYDPAKTGMQLAKIKARWPYYAGAAVRHIAGYLVDGVLTDVQTRHFFLKEIDGPNDLSFKFQARGVLDLANVKTALCPKPSLGQLAGAMTAVQTTFSLSVVGAGAAYPSSGRVCIGSEMMDYTRFAEAFTVVRGVRTTAATHAAGDTVQQVYSVSDQTLDAAMNSLILGYTDTPASYLDAGQQALNAAEVTRWGASVRVTTDIVAPTAVALLLGELQDLGCAIWENPLTRKINIQINRPVQQETVRVVTESMIKEMSQEDRDDDRLTQVLFLSKRADPTKSLDDENNYGIRLLTVSQKAMALYGDAVKSRTIKSRWLDQGDEATVALTSLRLLDRLKDAPKRITVTLDAEEKSADLVDVLSLTTDDIGDPTGLPGTRLMQVISRTEPTPYHDIELMLQAFSFDGRYGYIAPDTVTANYTTATPSERLAYAFIAPDTGKFADGTDAYEVI